MKASATGYDVAALRVELEIEAGERLVERCQGHGVGPKHLEHVLGHSISELTGAEYTYLEGWLARAEEAQRKNRRPPPLVPMHRVRPRK